MLQVTTSWDDGDVLDERLAELLDKYHIKGTFYITRHYRPERLSEGNIRTLAQRHEVGAHTLTHPNLTKISRAEKESEIQGGKQWLESVIGKEVPMFCYPAGHFDAEAKGVVQGAGFKGARTTRLGALSMGSDAFEMPTTLGVYPMPFRKVGPHTYYWSKLLQPLIERMPALRKLHIPLAAFRSWEALAKAAFDEALEKGGVFHLWGHSWEIEKYGMWNELERVLAYIGNHPACRYVTNGDLFSSY